MVFGISTAGINTRVTRASPVYSRFASKTKNQGLSLTPPLSMTRLPCQRQGGTMFQVVRVETLHSGVKREMLQRRAAAVAVGDGHRSGAELCLAAGTPP